MSIRTATPADLDAMFDISRSAHLSAPYTAIISEEFWQQFAARYEGTERNREDYRRRQMKYLSGPRGSAFVYEEGGVVVAYRLLEHVNNILYLKGIFVHPSYQGRGIGRQLFGQTLQCARPNTTVRLTVLKANARARQLYESYSFLPVKERVADFYGAKQIVMERKY